MQFSVLQSHSMERGTVKQSPIRCARQWPQAEKEFGVRALIESFIFSSSDEHYTAPLWRVSEILAPFRLQMSWLTYLQTHRTITHFTSLSTVCQSPKFLIVSICDLLDVINCQFREFAAAPLGPVHFLLPYQQSGIHCLIICSIQLLTPNNSGGTWRRICSPDMRSVSALKMFT